MLGQKKLSKTTHRPFVTLTEREWIGEGAVHRERGVLTLVGIIVRSCLLDRIISDVNICEAKTLLSQSGSGERMTYKYLQCFPLCNAYLRDEQRLLGRATHVEDCTRQMMPGEMCSREKRDLRM